MAGSKVLRPIEQNLEELRKLINQMQEVRERLEVQTEEQIEAQFSLVTKVFEDRMDRLEAKLETFSGKEPLIETGTEDTTDKGIPITVLPVSSVKPNASKGVPVKNVVCGEIEAKGVDGSNQYNGEQGFRGYLPELPFPVFDGTDPAFWAMKCEDYFDLYQIPESKKTLLAVLNFNEIALRWYRGFKGTNEHPPWAVLVKEVKDRFRNWGAMNPVGEFKWLYQTGSVEEYLKKFERAQARLLIEFPSIPKTFFVSSFICGLKEEIKHMVEMFEPNTVLEAFRLATHHEMHLRVVSGQA